MATDNYMISILGEQILDGEKDKVEVLTSGNFMKKKDHFYIGYKEYDENDPNQHFDNLIKVEDNIVTITRKGPMRSQLMLEKGKRHQCVYETVAGTLIIGVYTRTMKSTLNESGGTLEVSYTLDFNSDLVSENSFKIKIEEKSNQSEVE